MEDYTTSRSEHFNEYFKMFPELNPNTKYKDGSILFRYHCRDLIESLESIVEISNKKHLEDIIHEKYGEGNVTVDEECSYDDRIDWNEYIVCHNDGAVGYLNSSL